jgi:subtilisin family serine protease
MLILFAASNDGAEGVPVSYASLGRQPTAKNVLSVGATLSDYNSYDFVYNDWSSGIMCAAAGECSSTCLSTFLCGFPPAMLLTSSQLCWGFVNMTVLVGQSTIQPVLSLFKETCEFAPIFCCSTCSPLSVYEEAQQFGSDSANCIAAMMQQMFAAHSRASFSSLGPTLDGRIKPDVVAPGYFITSARAQPPAPLLSEIYDCSRVTNSSECGSSRTSELDHLLQHSQSIIQYVQPKLGTSMATPITAGNAVLVRQYFIDGFFPTGAPSAADGFSPSAALMKAVLVAGAMPLAFAQHPAWYFRWATTRDISQEYVNAGFGSVNLIRSLSFASLGTSQRSLGQVQTMALPGYTFVESASGSNPPRTASEPSVEHGNTMQFCVDTYTTLRAESLSVNLPLTISLVWTDPPASPAALYVLVNNLDLEVNYDVLIFTPCTQLWTQTSIFRS